LVVEANQPDLSVKRKLMQAAETSARENNGKVIDLIDGFCRTKDGTHDFYKFLGYNNEGSMAKVYLRKEL
jgi:histone acetyltransferase (RNA polymerase elongator complex component)